MSAAIDGKRPALPGKGFRHVARHRYGFDLDPRKVDEDLARVRAAFPAFVKAVTCLERMMTAAKKADDEPSGSSCTLWSWLLRNVTALQRRPLPQPHCQPDPRHLTAAPVEMRPLIPLQVVGIACAEFLALRRRRQAKYAPNESHGPD
ncbi:hypothetical protein [Bradyrhizobium brasilense]|uniref:hypothetical protein n=1 Tax=Bradyrhizobium brasilense TaxID=1419277 RepID=UPI003133CE7A